MKNPYKKHSVFVTGVLIAIALMGFAATAHANTDGTEGLVVEEADVLTIQLGPLWAGVEFELVTDAGRFPVPVVVSDVGILTMELGGSTTYTLSAMNSSVPIPDPDDDDEPESQNTDVQAPATNLPEEDETDLPDTEDELPTEDDSSETSDTTSESRTILGIPIMHLVLFVFGLLLCVTVLIYMRVMRDRIHQNDEDEDWDEDDS